MQQHLIGALPLAFDDVNGICVVGGYGESFLGFFMYNGLHGLLFLIAPMITTVAFVIDSYCYTKHYIAI